MCAGWTLTDGTTLISIRNAFPPLCFPQDTHIFRISLCCSFESFFYFTSAAGMLVRSGLGLCDEVWLQSEAARKIGPPGKKRRAVGSSLGHHEANTILLSSRVFPSPVGSHGTFLGLKNNPHPALLVGLMMITAFRPSS